MDNHTVTQLLQETIKIAEEEGMVASMDSFKSFVGDMLPQDVINQLEEILDSADFLEDIWKDKFEPATVDDEGDSADDLKPGHCLVCERRVRLTKHHVFPRETHSRLVKKGYDAKALNTTIGICRMCHSTIHRFFTNDELSESYYTLDLLLADEKFLRYAKWASTQ